MPLLSVAQTGEQLQGWQMFASPDFDAVVQVSDEDDLINIASPTLMHVITYRPDAEFDEVAQSLGHNLRQSLLNAVPGGELHAYGNHAIGHESIENMYGYEAWRVTMTKLKSLEGGFDATNAFLWYAPVGLSSQMLSRVAVIDWI